MASDYQYLTVAEYVAFDLGVSGVTNAALAEKHFSHAEKLIDAYCGPWPRFYTRDLGQPSAVSGATVTADVFGSYPTNYWAKGGLYLVVYDGPGAGEERLITASTSSSQATLVSGITGMTTASLFVLRQKSVFPRAIDVDVADVPFIPDAVKLATAAQVAFAVQKGSEGAGLWASEPVLGEKGALISETYGSGYSYQKDTSQQQGIFQFLSPQARELLRGYVTRVGRLATKRYTG